MAKTSFSYKEIMKGIMEDGNGKEIPEQFYCGECGLVLTTLDISYKLEKFFSAPGKAPIYIDVCDCNPN